MDKTFELLKNWFVEVSDEPSSFESGPGVLNGNK